MKSISKHYYWVIGFSFGFLLILIEMTAEDILHHIPIREALSSFHHFYIPLLTGVLLGIIAYLYWKIKDQEITSKNKLLKKTG